MIDNQFLEVVAAPAYSDESLKIFNAKPNVRVLSFKPKINDKNKILSVSGGLLIQSADNKIINEDNLEVVTKKVPNKDEIQNALFAWKVCKYVKSNAIVFAASEQTLGIGAGQMSRIDSGKIAASKAKEFGFSLNGASMASDAFFPFPCGGPAPTADQRGDLLHQVGFFASSFARTNCLECIALQCSSRH